MKEELTKIGLSAGSCRPRMGTTSKRFAAGRPPSGVATLTCLASVGRLRVSCLAAVERIVSSMSGREAPQRLGTLQKLSQGPDLARE